jgi:FKBP-type peptidyl-prolyl cis-trans isomerase
MRLSVGFVLVALSIAGCGSDGGSPTAPSPAPTINVPFSATDLRVGTGAEATPGRNTTVRYTGWIYSTTAPDNKGTQFDSGTIPVTVGQGVIQGFSMGLNGMRVGGLRRVVIPPNLGYGNNPPPGSGIRANETLLFEIELVTVQ